MYITPYYRNSFNPFFQQIDRLFENVFESELQPAYAGLNVYEKDDRYHVSLEAPGFAKDAFQVEVENGVIQVKAESSASDDEAATRRSISRAFRLPESVDGSSISAKYENGILTLDLPKQPASIAQKIQIQ